MYARHISGYRDSKLKARGRTGAAGSAGIAEI